MLKVHILHNIISPYRQPLFDGLAKYYSTKVYYCKETYKNRLWDTSTNLYKYQYKILPSITIGFFVINYTLIKELLRDKADVYIIVENPENLFSVITVFIIAKILNKKIIIWSERPDDEIFTVIQYRDSNNYIKRLLYKLIKSAYHKYRKVIYIFSDSLIALSRAAFSNISDTGVTNTKIVQSIQVMPESLLHRSGNISKAVTFDGKTVILYVGYLKKEKGVGDLIKAFKKLNNENTVLLIVGAGDYENTLKYMANGSQNIKFVGYLEGEEKSKYYQSADFFVFPTHYDIWGLVTNEALYFGLPVIISSQAYSKDLISNDRGFIFEGKNIDDLADKMDLLIHNQKLLANMKTKVSAMSKDSLINVEMQVDHIRQAIAIAQKDKGVAL